MGRWLELFRTLKNVGSIGLTDSDTSRHTDAHAPKNSGIDGLTDSDTSRHTAHMSMTGHHSSTF